MSELNTSGSPIRGFLRVSLAGMGLAVCAVVIHYLGISLVLNHWKLSWVLFFVFLLVGFVSQFVVLWLIHAKDKREGRMVCYCFAPNPLLSLALLFGVLLVCWSIPAFILFHLYNPEPPKKAVKIAVFLLSLGTGLVYYAFNQQKFPSLADRIGFLTAVTLTPVGIMEVLW